MKEHLTSTEHLAFRRIDKIIQLRKEPKHSALILLGSNTVKLTLALEHYFLSRQEVEKFTPKTLNPLYELSNHNSEHFHLLNLYEHHSMEAIVKALQFARDFVAQNALKLIILLDVKSYEKIQDEAHDFFSVNSFAYQFVDHAYTFERSQVAQSTELQSYIDKYHDYHEHQAKPEAKILIELLFNIAKEAYAFSLLSLAEEYYLKAYLMAKNHQFNYEQSVLAGNIGLIYRAKGDLEEALKYHKEALEIDREIGYTQGVASDLGNIGLIYRAKGDLEEALKYLKEALEIHREIGYTQGVANQLGNIGLIYSDKGDLKEALKYLKEALEIFKEIGYKAGIDIVQRNIDEVLEQLTQSKK